MRENTEYWLIWFEDSDRQPELFTDELAARSWLEKYSLNWNVHLFKKLPAEAPHA